jgi:hypothetical protein
MWAKLVKSLAIFSSAVLTGLDADGYPFSVRCTLRPDHERQVLNVHLPAASGIQPGLAGLLCHSHDEWLWNLKSFGIQGRLEQEAGGWVFHPLRFIPGAGMEGPLGQFRMIQKGRKSAQQYLEKRGLPRPAVDWQGIKALRAQLKK